MNKTGNWGDGYNPTELGVIKGPTLNLNLGWHIS